MTRCYSIGPHALRFYYFNAGPLPHHASNDPNF